MDGTWLFSVFTVAGTALLFGLRFGRLGKVVPVTAILTVVPLAGFVGSANEWFHELAVIVFIIVPYVLITWILISKGNSRADRRRSGVTSAFCVTADLFVSLVLLDETGLINVKNDAAVSWAIYLLFILPLAIWSGYGDYNELMKLERADSGDSRKGGLAQFARLILLAFITLGLLIVSLDQSAGTRTTNSAYPVPVPVLTLVGVGLAGLALVVSFGRRPRHQVDDLLRVHPVTFVAGGLAMSLLLFESVRVTMSIPSGLPFPWLYLALALASAIGFLYAEDIWANSVRLHILRPAWLAGSLALLAGLAVAAGCYAMLTRYLWQPDWVSVSFESAMRALVPLGLVQIAVALVAMSLAFSSSGSQQLTAKSAQYNVTQGTLLYFFLTLLVAWLPSIVLAQLFGNDAETVLLAVAVYGALALLVVFVVRYTFRNNASHLESEARRHVKQLEDRARDQLDYTELNGIRLRRLRQHLWCQQYLAYLALLISGLGILALIWHVLSYPLKAVENDSTA